MEQLIFEASENSMKHAGITERQKLKEKSVRTRAVANEIKK
jgi:hypothetical protein